MIQFFTTNLLYTVLSFFFGGLLLTYYLVPKIINVVNHKKLMDSPNQRSSHVKLTPTFGGISFFVILILSLLLLRSFDSGEYSLNIIAALTILLFTGLKDDLVVISNTSKLLGQIAAIVIFLLESNLYEFNFHGFIGIYELTPVIGYIITAFIMLSIINAFNLIDGIDGLAASIGVIALSFFFVVFYALGDAFFSVISITMVGSLLAFLRFNLSKDKKIFMGDTGSQIIGFVVAIMTMRFLNLDVQSFESLGFIQGNAFVIVASILVFPIFDMARILIFRTSKKKNPLKADKNHIHHILLNVGFTHKKSTLLISLTSIAFSAAFLIMSSLILNNWILLSLFIISFIVFYYLFFRLIKKMNSKEA